MKTFSVIGGGAWGTALAQNLTRGGHRVKLWALETDVAEAVNRSHENTVYLPDVSLSEEISATNDIADACVQDVILLVAPAQHMRATLETMKPHLKDPQALVLCSKGIEIETGALMSNVLEDTLGQDMPYAVLSGPTFAKEVAEGLPTAATIASENKELARTLAQDISTKLFRLYTCCDPVGAEIGGAVKNVIAIACGIVHGRELGDSARSAVMTRGLSEIARLGAAMGAKKETLMGLSGIGDLTLTCGSMQSRNFSLGALRGQGHSLNEILAKRNSVAEGLSTSAAIQDLAKKHAVEMPICAAVNETMNNGTTIDDIIEGLLSRPLQEEAA